MRKKLVSSRGETLVETLVSILIVGLVSAGLAAMIAGASRVERTAEQADQTLYAAITAAEKRTNGVDGQLQLTVTASGTAPVVSDVPVTCWGSDGLYAYGKRATP